nr:hypothetical protein BaRGS_023864 [Batillaria attramentaria]
MFTVQLRRQGVRLFLVWYQILQDNASDECHRIFQQLVPGLGEGDLNDLFSSRAGSTPDSISGMIAAGEITPILPSTTEKMPENITKYFLDHLLNYMVSEVIKIEWMNKEMREVSFTFLFNKFKSKYLLWLLPDFHARDIYEPVLELPRERSEEEMQSKDEPANVTECRDSFIIWLANFTMTSRRPDPDLIKGLSCSALTESPPGGGEDAKEGGEGKADNQDQSGGSSKLGLGGDSFSGTDHDSIHSSQGGDEHSVTEYEIVRSVLYSTRENVNIVHECFRQHAEQRPLFLLEPSEAMEDLEQRDMPDFLHNSLSDIMEEEDSPSASALSLIPQTGVLTDDRQRYRRNRSYLGAVAELADAGAERMQDVRAGAQRILQVFVTNAANIFLLNTEDSVGLQDQTLIVTWIKANLNVLIATELWDEFLAVLSSLTSWIELIREWAVYFVRVRVCMLVCAESCGWVVGDGADIL